MKVFVIGTGRCGTTTFARACKHITNFRSGQESTDGMRGPNALTYPDNFIEVNPFLVWMLDTVAARNSVDDTIYIHLRREREAVVSSWVRRGQGRGPGLWTPLAWRVPGQKLTPAQYEEACYMCHDEIVARIKDFGNRSGVKMQPLWLECMPDDWDWFWNEIGAEGDLDAARAEWTIRHNAS